MLKGIMRLLGPERLAIRRAMGHGDEIAIVDANYPAAHGRRLVRMDGHNAPAILDAVLSLVPIAGEAFYDRTRAADAIAAGGERRLHGNIIPRKGVIAHEEAAP